MRGGTLRLCNRMCGWVSGIQERGRNTIYMLGWAGSAGLLRVRNARYPQRGRVALPWRAECTTDDTGTGCARAPHLRRVATESVGCAAGRKVINARAKPSG